MILYLFGSTQSLYSATSLRLPGVSGFGSSPTLPPLLPMSNTIQSALAAHSWHRLDEGMARLRCAFRLESIIDTKAFRSVLIAGNEDGEGFFGEVFQFDSS